MVMQHIIVILIRRLIMFSFIFWVQSFSYDYDYEVMISIIFVSILWNFYKASKAVSARHNFA